MAPRFKHLSINDDRDRNAAMCASRHFLAVEHEDVGNKSHEIGLEKRFQTRLNARDIALCEKFCIGQELVHNVMLNVATNRGTLLRTLQ